MDDGSNFYTNEKYFKKMKIFIDLGHPAHVHYFKNFIRILEEEKFSFMITARQKDVTFNLLDELKINYIDRGKGESGLVRKFIYMFKADFLIFKKAKKFKPDIFISFASPYAAQVAYFMNNPHIAITDTEHATIGNLAFSPFSKKVLTPSCYKKNFGKKHVRFDSYMEISYLHPKYFKPNIDVLNLLGIKNNERFSILRFVSWQATHDLGHKGISNNNKINAVNEFKKYGKVFISSESELPEKLKKYKINIPSTMMHDALFFASLLYGESATMASECSILGTPSIFLDNSGRGYTDEQQKKYGLVFNFTESLIDLKKSIEKGIEILQNNKSSDFWKEKSKKIIEEKIDPTQFFIDFIKKYENK